MIKRLITLPAALKVSNPRLAAAMEEWKRRHLASFSRDFFAWGISALLLAFMFALLLGKIFLAGSNLTAQAILVGQRELVFLNTGEIEGNARHTQQTATPATTATATGDGVATIISKEGLAPAPLESISLQTDKGLIPIVGKDGILPWKYYARPYKGDVKRPIVAIVITDLGLSKPLTEQTLTLPHPFTLSFSPYASDSRKWATKAREEGFETLVDVPMETVDFVRTGADPGPYGLMVDSSSNEVTQRLRWVLSRFPGFVGMLAPENEDLTANLSTFRPTLMELAGHGVLFLYIKTPQNTALSDLIKSRQLYALGIDKVIDDDIAPGPIDKQLEGLTALAKAQGYAIGFAHSYPPTLEALSRWFETLDAQGVALAPVSAVATRIFP